MRSDQSECVICVDTCDLAPGRSVVKCTVPQMIPKPQTIPKIDLKWYSTQVIPKVDHKWIREKLRNGMDCMGLIMKKKLFFSTSEEKGKEDATSQLNLLQGETKNGISAYFEIATWLQLMNMLRIVISTLISPDSFVVLLLETVTRNLNLVMRNAKAG